MQKKLTRSTRNRVFGGVCGGLAEYFNADPVLVRVIVILSVFVFNVFTVLMYILMWMILPLNTDNAPAPASAPSEPQKTTADLTVSVPPSAPTPDNTPPADNSNRVFSTALAVLLIIAGIGFFLPWGTLPLGRFFAFGLAIVLLLFAGKLIYEALIQEPVRMMGFTLGGILATFGIFVALQQFGLIGFWVYAQYFKSLLATVLILWGFTLVLKNTGNRYVMPAIASLVLITAALFSVYRSDRFLPPWAKEPLKIWQSGGQMPGSYSDSKAMPAGLEKLTYQIDNSAGSLQIAGSTNLYLYDGNGVPPQVIYKDDNGKATVQFIHQAASTRLWISSGATSDVNVKVSAGDVNFAVPASVQKLNVENNLGHTTLRLTRSRPVTLRAVKAITVLNLPPEFERNGQVYTYRGTAGEPLEITMTVNMGNVDVRFE